MRWEIQICSLSLSLSFSLRTFKVKLVNVALCEGYRVSKKKRPSRIWKTSAEKLLNETVEWKYCCCCMMKTVVDWVRSSRHIRHITTVEMKLQTEPIDWTVDGNCQAKWLRWNCRLKFLTKVEFYYLYAHALQRASPTHPSSQIKPSNEKFDSKFPTKPSNESRRMKT